jgi:2-polyprenyl-3-methyl-5-hydroxy-6-metoxy-1,4-benzoquinol methylase
MVQKILIDILIYPFAKQKLDYNEIENGLSINNVKLYEIMNEVPMILIQNDTLKENTIDTIIASEIIEHLHAPKLFIKKLLQVLKPGGKNYSCNSL